MGEGFGRIDVRRSALLLACLLALGSCAPKLIPPAAAPPRPAAPPAPPPPAAPVYLNALDAGVHMGGSLAGLDPAAAVRAREAFALSCPALLARADASGLAPPESWRPACAEASAIVLDRADLAAVDFFRRHFELAEVSDGSTFLTGYYEPQIRGSRTPLPGYVPIYGRPADLLDADPLTGAKGRGRIDEAGLFTLYHDRAGIEDGALAGRGLEIAWAADAIDLFFLQIQGSGRLLLPDGNVMRIGYAAQNGREYIAIGKLLKERGLLGDGPVTMQGIVGWLRAHPEEGRAIMRENKSYVFFRELTGAGPIGALGLPVTPRITVAADPKFVPLGAPVLIAADRAEASGLWIAQDTGGAIKGPNRFDTFWGAGEEAARIAGGMQAKGKAYLLLPKGSLARLEAHATPPQP